MSNGYRKQKTKNVFIQNYICVKTSKLEIETWVCQIQIILIEKKIEKKKRRTEENSCTGEQYVAG